MKRQIIILAACTMLIFSGCKKEPTTNEPTNPPANPSSTAFLLNEGNWGSNDAEISLVNLAEGTLRTNWFSSQNGRGLGDVAQDLIHYGNKLYATVYQSGKLEVIDPITGKSIKQIDMGNRGPRYLAAHDGKVYVSCYDKSIVRIDTASLSIEATCRLSGMQPEQLCILGNDIVVCNCWQYDNDGQSVYDNTLSVVDIASFTESRKIQVGTNPGKIKALDSHRCIVACSGDYGANPAQTIVLDLSNDSQETIPINATNFDVCNGNIYLYATAYDENWNTTTSFYKMDINTLSCSPILESHSNTLSNAYGINIDPSIGNIYICNSAYGMNGDLYCFAPDGKELWHAEACFYASKVVF